MKYIFGPVLSRRFGASLGVNLSPDSKRCNFDCLYCELKSAEVVDSIDNEPEVAEVIKDIKEAIKRYKIDVITITANGEPTLYSKLNELIDEINLIKGDKKTLILSNGSLVYKKEVKEALLKFDMVKLSLDCVSKEAFKKLDRALDLNIDRVIESMIDFRKSFKNTLLLEILFVKSLNDSDEEIEKLNEAILKIEPDRLDLNSIDRPPAFDVKGLDYLELFEISKKFSKDLNIAITSRKEIKSKQSYSKDEIISTIRYRPLNESDIENLFDSDSKKIFEKLLKDGYFKEKNIAGVKFFYKNSKKA